MKNQGTGILRGILLILAFGLLLAGLLSGDLTAVMQKAATVCLECIGIG